MRRPQRKFSKHRIITLLFFVVAAVAVMGGILAIPHDRLLLERAMPVSSVATIDSSNVTMQIRDDYHWIANDKVLFFRGLWNPGELELWERDLATGTNRPMTALTRLFNRSFARHTEQVVSPDGKYLCWYGTEGELNVATLDGSSHSQSVPLPDYGINNLLCWSTDSKEVIVLIYIEYTGKLRSAILNDVKDVRRHKTLHFPADTLLHVDDRLVFGPDQTLTAASCSYNTLLPSVIRVDLKTGVEKNISIPFPGSESWIERTSVPSPDGRRIAWNVAYMTYDQPLAFLHRYFSAIPVPEHRYQAIWVSRTDGGSAEEIGRVAVPKDQEESENLNVRWLPDSRRISFVYGERLWTISANR